MASARTRDANTALVSEGHHLRRGVVRSVSVVCEGHHWWVKHVIDGV